MTRIRIMWNQWRYPEIWVLWKEQKWIRNPRWRSALGGWGKMPPVTSKRWRPLPIEVRRG